MNLPAKAALTTGRDVWTTADGVRLSDGPHGLRYQEPDANSLDFADSRASTCFPPAVALGCTWDRDLIERVGAAIGAEAAALGVDVVLGPGVNIKRSPLCGRNFEYFAEDPLLSGEAGAALVRGLQGAGVGACVKHYAANNQETDRLRVSADVDERPLREIYLRAFERVVRQAAPWTVMAAYNAVNGIPATQNRWLLTEVLREEWGFDGVVMSDWGAVKDRVAALRAGLDLEMPGSGSAAEVVAAVEAGLLEEDVLDLAVERLTALSRRARRRGVPSGEAVPYGEHHELAREAAARGIVLLKNDGGLLPLDPASTIAVVGELARTPRYQGGGSSHVRPTRLDTPLEHLGDVLFSPGADLDLVRRADTTVLFLGLPEEEESEGYDRTTLDLPADQLELLDRVSSATDRLVVVLVNGGVVSVTPWQDRVPALVESWLLGQGGGAALADVLFGRVNPSGRLAETIPLRLQDVPSYLHFPGAEGHVRYGEGVHVGYRGYDALDLPVAYPFGHGLSYTEFGYADLTVSCGEDLVARVTVTNTGARAGREVVQLYVARQLRAFEVADLEPGESAVVELRLPVRDLAYYSVRDGGWRVEGGTYAVEVGASSRDIRARADVEVAGDRRPLTGESTLRESMDHPVVAELLRESKALSNPMLLRAAMEMSLEAIAAFPGSPLTEERLKRLLEEG